MLIYGAYRNGIFPQRVTFEGDDASDQSDKFVLQIILDVCILDAGIKITSALGCYHNRLPDDSIS